MVERRRLKILYALLFTCVYIDESNVNTLWNSYV